MNKYILKDFANNLYLINVKYSLALLKRNQSCSKYSYKNNVILVVDFYETSNYLQ